MSEDISRCPIETIDARSQLNEVSEWFYDCRLKLLEAKIKLYEARIKKTGESDKERRRRINYAKILVGNTRVNLCEARIQIFKVKTFLLKDSIQKYERKKNQK